MGIYPHPWDLDTAINCQVKDNLCKTKVHEYALSLGDIKEEVAKIRMEQRNSPWLNISMYNASGMDVI
jgi:hypothetical protein